MERRECNLSLDELLKFEGVMAAGIFSADGKLSDYKAKMEMAKEMAEMTAKFCGVIGILKLRYPEILNVGFKVMVNKTSKIFN